MNKKQKEQLENAKKELLHFIFNNPTDENLLELIDCANKFIDTNINIEFLKEEINLKKKLKIEEILDTESGKIKNDDTIKLNFLNENPQTINSSDAFIGFKTSSAQNLILEKFCKIDYKNTINLLFLTGDLQSEEDHLMNVICNRITQNNPSASILFIDSIDFHSELLSTLTTSSTLNEGKRTLNEFFIKYNQEIDFLLINIINPLIDNYGTTRTLVHIISNRIKNGKKTVLSLKHHDDYGRFLYKWL